MYVQGVSRAAVSVTNYCAGSGATVASVSLTGGDLSVYASSGVSPILTTSGSVTFTAVIKDSRGRTATVSKTISVTAYVPIAISGISAFRSNASGEQDVGGGTYGKASCAYIMASIGSNAATVRMFWKKSTDSSWTELSWPDASGTEQVFGGGELSLSSRYDVRFIASDAFTSAERTMQIGPGSVFMRWDKIKQAFGFGCRPEYNRSVQLADDWDIWHQGRKITGSTRIPGGADLNSYTTQGMYYNDYNVDVASMQHTPVPYAFALLVEKSAGVKQTFTRYEPGDPRMWVRNYYNGEWGSWVEMVNTTTVGWYAVQAAHPVGSLYLSTDSTSPASIFGGTWTQITDRFLLAAGGNYGVGSYGGEAYHALSLGELPNVTGSISMHSAGDSTNVHSVAGCFSSGLTNTNAYKAGGSKASGAQSVGVINFSLGGGGSGHNNMPPYYAVYMWRRIG